MTGDYRRDDLVDLIEANGINLFFFPSICPETFSYVIEEMICSALPIVAFDLGAPGERLRELPATGACASDVSARAALATLVGYPRAARGAAQRRRRRTIARSPAEAPDA